jgi:UDP-glucose 4-epimerase
MSKQTQRYFVTGGAGFIGAHLVNRLLDTTAAEVVVYDNFSTGRRWPFGERTKDPRLMIIEADVADLPRLQAAMTGSNVVYHLASNSDIARAAEEPGVDFWNGLYLTYNVLEAMRLCECKRLLFPSGSGVYGDVPPTPLPEAYAHSIPISTYGASKLGGEAFVSAYSHMFGIKGTVLRFANVVGPHQTHGVAYDFIRRLLKNPRRLLIHGDGRQSKPYIFIADVLAAFQLTEQKQSAQYEVFNVGTEDHLTVAQIAEMVAAQMKLTGVVFDYTGGARGWQADVPVYRLKTDKIRGLGWQSRMNSKEAVAASVTAMLEDARQGRITPAAK